VALPVQIRFSPQGGCTDAVVAALAAARSSIFVQAYSFTSVAIAAALLAAQRRGVNVHVILDRSNLGEKYSELTFFRNNQVPVLVDAAHAIAHNKIMVIDAAVLLTGSFNFTTNAELHNAENLLVITDPTLALIYTANWQAHAAHSRA
jgi:phosphatidylserine/phosphatidylglycerophosphate/cardiolipin synthase-like enzyme